MYPKRVNVWILFPLSKFESVTRYKLAEQQILHFSYLVTSSVYTCPAHLWEVFEAGDGCSKVTALERGLDEHDSGSFLSVLVLQQQSV